MDLSVAFLGTGGAGPSARRSPASRLASRGGGRALRDGRGGLLVAGGGERVVIDCGEGTQRQLQKSLGLVQVDEIYLTHFHADHFLGLPGMVKAYALTAPRASAPRARGGGRCRRRACCERLPARGRRTRTACP